MAQSKIKQLLQDPERLSDILSTATYDSPWFGVSVHPHTPEVLYKNTEFECREDKWARVLLGGGWLEVEDVEEENSYKVGMKEFEKGFRKFMEECPHNYANIMEENEDFYDADALLQTIVFGEVVYG